MFFRKFYSIEFETKSILFSHLCTDLYGAELWWNIRGSHTTLKQFGVSYHLALKRLLGFPKHASNHHVCHLLHQFTCEHMLRLNTLKFFRRLTNSQSPCLASYRLYFQEHSDMKRSLHETFNSNYDIANVHINDLDAVLSRVTFVQSREDSSWNDENYNI